MLLLAGAEYSLVVNRGNAYSGLNVLIEDGNEEIFGGICGTDAVV